RSVPGPKSPSASPARWPCSISNRCRPSTSGPFAPRASSRQKGSSPWTTRTGVSPTTYTVSPSSTSPGEMLVTTPDKPFCATGTAGWRNVVDSGNDLPTDPSVACAHTTCEDADPAASSSGTADVNVARDAHHPAPAAATT